MKHNINDPRHPWRRLTAAARQIGNDRDTMAPYAFSTRIVARAFGAERQMESLFERFALRALGVACLLALSSVAVNYKAISNVTANPQSTLASADEMVWPTSDAVSVVLGDLAD
jgi:hypothetical protein